MHDSHRQKINLTAIQIEMLKERHKPCRDQKECDRIKAILLRNKSWSMVKIVEALLIHKTNITRYIDDYLEHQKLQIQSEGSDSYLSDEHTKRLTQHLCDVTYSHQHHFSYKKPKGVPHKFDEEKQAEFIKEYERLKSTLAPDELLLFMGAVHPTQATKIIAGWIKNGEAIVDFIENIRKSYLAYGTIKLVLDSAGYHLQT